MLIYRDMYGRRYFPPKGTFVKVKINENYDNYNAHREI